MVQPGGSPSGDGQAGEGRGQPAARRGGRWGSAPGSRTGLGTSDRMRREQGWGVPRGPSPSAAAGVPPGRRRRRRRGRGGGAGAALSRCGPGTGIASGPAAIGPGGRPPPRSVLTEDAVLLQGAVDLAVGVDLQVVLGGTEELPAPGRSPQVLVDAAAAPRIPARPGVAGGGSGRARGARLLPQAQEQDPNYEHCGMMAAASSLLGRRRLGASGTGGPIRDVSLAARRAGEARSGPGGEASASSYRPRSGPFICLRFT